MTDEKTRTRPHTRDICDLFKQVCVLPEPFTRRELVAVSTVTSPTVKVWLDELELLGMVTQHDNFYWRSGALKT